MTLATTTSSPAAIAAGDTILSVSNIEVVYDHVILVLKGVSLDVPRGGIVALLGANGAGRPRPSRRSRICCMPSAAR